MFETFLIIGVVLMVTGWCGANTALGRRYFDRKTAIIPIAALILGTAVFARGLWLFVRR
jgi:hypothetical protein